MSGQVAIIHFASGVITTWKQLRKELLMAPFVHPRGTDRPKTFKDDASLT